MIYQQKEDSYLLLVSYQCASDSSKTARQTAGITAYHEYIN